MGETQTVVFLHGLGETPAVWEHHIATLPDGFDGIALAIPGLSEADAEAGPFSLAHAAASIAATVVERGIRHPHYCGLSLGAMLALRIAIDQPGHMRSLTLTGGQSKPPRAIMVLQRALIRLLPERVVASTGASKTRMRQVLSDVARIDFSDDLANVTVPTLVMCGAKDRVNLPAARWLARGIRNAELQIIDGAGHQAHSDAPERFGALLNEFLRRQTEGASGT